MITPVKLTRLRFTRSQEINKQLMQRIRTDEEDYLDLQFKYERLLEKVRTTEQSQAEHNQQELKVHKITMKLTLTATRRDRASSEGGCLLEVQI